MPPRVLPAPNLRRYSRIPPPSEEPTMNITKTAFSVAAALVLGSAAEVALSDNTDATADRIKAAVTPGEMVLSGSDVKSIHTGSTVAKYRVCMKKEQGDAEMKV